MGRGFCQRAFNNSEAKLAGTKYGIPTAISFVCGRISMTVVTRRAHAGVQQQHGPGSNDSGHARDQTGVRRYQQTRTRLTLPFPFFSKRAGTEGVVVWPRKPIRSAGKERSAAVALVLREALSSENRSGWRGGKEEPPPEYQTRRGIVDWTDQPYSDPRLSPRACLNRQAGFTAARPAANWIPS